MHPKVKMFETEEKTLEKELQKLHYWETDQFEDVIVCPSASFDQVILFYFFNSFLII